MEKRIAVILLSIISLVTSINVGAQEEVLFKIYAEELNVIRSNRQSYFYSAYGIIDETVPEAAKLRDAVDRDLDEFGASLDEYLAARSIVSINPEYHKFIFAHRLPDKDELSLFNKYVSAELNTIPSPLDGSIPTPSLPKAERENRVKMKAESTDPVTGGKMWTFANGIKVIYKKAGLKGRFNYGLVIKGGENVFVGDMLEYFDVGKMKWYDFRRLLDLDGIIMKPEVSTADLRITGSAPTEALQDLLQSISLLAAQGRLNPEGFDLYKKKESVLLKKTDLDANIDSLLRRNYDYSQYRFKSHLTDNLRGRAQEYYEKQFARFNDGVIVFIGDLDEKELCTTLEKNLGAFPTGKNYYVRPSIQYELRTGSSVHMVYDSYLSPGVNIALSLITPVSADAYIALDFLKVIVEKELHTEVRTSVELFPQERMTMIIRFGDKGNPSAALTECRAAITKLLETPITDDQLSLYKSYLMDQYNVRKSSPDWMIKNAFYRYSQGKDFMGKYEEKIRKLTNASFSSLLRLLNEGSRVEYIVLKKD